MLKRNKSFSIKTLYLAAAGTVFILSGILTVLLVDYHLGQQVLKDAESRACALLEHSMAIRTYFTRNLKPSIFELLDSDPSAVQFNPIWMSSTYAIRQIDQHFQSLCSLDYQYKECAINARRPDNEASDFEKRFLEEVNRDPNLTVRSVIQELDGKRYFVTLRRGELLEESCLRCHGRPEEAPEGLLARYGPERGFHRRPGEIADVLSIRVPVSAALLETRRFSLQLSGMLLAGLFLIFLVLNQLNRRLLMKPLSAVRNQALAISSGSDRLGGQIALPRGRELSDLTEAFNAMSARLRKTQDDMEEVIRERTEELLAANDQLKKQIENHEKVRQALQLSETQLKESHRTLLTVLDGVDATVHVADMKTHEILFMNQHMKDTFGGDRTGEICWRAFRNASEPCPHCTNPRLLDAGGNPTGLQVWEVKNPVSGKWYMNYDRAIKWVNGRYVRLQIATDITRLKTLEDERSKMESQLRHSQKMEAIGTLAGGIAHDFNNILAAIIGCTELALGHASEETELHELLRVALQSGFRGRDLVKQILTFSRREETEKKPVPVVPLVREVLKLLRSTLPASIEIREAIEDENGVIQADATQIHQLLINLCTNAAQAMRAKGGILEVGLSRLRMDENNGQSLSEFRPGSYLDLKVADTGHGMTAKVMERIFEPYFTTKDKASGTGLGLAVVHGIVEGHGGSITVSSRPGAGAIFHVYLPLIETEILAMRPGEQDTAIAGGSERILFVDDEPTLVDVYGKILEKLGYQVTSASDSQQALDLFHRDPERFDLVITDMTMPKMAGDRLACALMKIRPEIPVILCTGYSDLMTEEKAMRIGIRAFLMKPVNARKLAETIRAVIQTR